MLKNKRGRPSKKKKMGSDYGMQLQEKKKVRKKTIVRVWGKKQLFFHNLILGGGCGGKKKKVQVEREGATTKKGMKTIIHRCLINNSN